MENARQTIIANFRSLASKPFLVIPHGRNFEQFHRINVSLSENEPIRILVPGNIAISKGGKVIAELGQMAAERGLENPHPRERPIARTSSAKRCSARRLRAFRVCRKASSNKAACGRYIFYWPETYCHTLTELWASGIPVIGFDFGAVGERIRRSGAGWLSAEPNAKGVIEILQHLRREPKEYKAKVDAVLKWQEKEGRIYDCEAMGHRYFDLYQKLMLSSGPQVVDPLLRRERAESTAFDPLLSAEEQILWDHLRNGELSPSADLKLSSASRFILMIPNSTAPLPLTRARSGSMSLD